MLLIERAAQIKDDYGAHHLLNILQEASRPFETADHRFLKAFCQMQNPSALLKLLEMSDQSKLVLETILQAHPPELETTDDTHTDQFLNSLIHGVMCLNDKNKKDALFHEIVTIVFAQEPVERQRYLVKRMRDYHQLLTFLEEIPAERVKELEAKDLEEVAHQVQEKQTEPSYQARLRVLAQAVTADQLYVWVKTGYTLEEVATALLPLVSSDSQAEVLARSLEDASKTHWTTALGKLESVQFPPNVWRKASQSVPELVFQYSFRNYPAERLIALMEGQSTNAKFKQEFLRVIFDDSDQLQGHQQECLAKLKTEFFVFDDVEKVNQDTWYEFNKALREMTDQKKAEAILIQATLALFNHPEFGSGHDHSRLIHALTEEQMGLLPIEKYQNPEMQLLIAAASHRLDDQMIDTANGLSDGNSFVWKFRTFYEASGAPDYLQKYYVFKSDIQYLEEFLAWILDRPSIAPLLPTWEWAIEKQKYGWLYGEEIKKNQQIQDRLKRAETEAKALKATK